jgi:gas vesicle protein
MLIFFVLLQQAENADKGYDKMILGGVLGIVATIVSWFLFRPKTNAETRKLESEADQLDQKTKLEWAAALADWINRFNEANKEIRAQEEAFEKELKAVKKELAECVESSAVNCREFKQRMLAMLEKFEGPVAAIDESLLKEMKDMREQIKA